MITFTTHKIKTHLPIPLPMLVGWLVDILDGLVDELMMVQQSRITAHRQAL